MSRLSRLWLLGSLVAFAPTVAAQSQDPTTRAFNFERRGRHAEAAQVYREILAGQPTDIGALLGMERSLSAMNKTTEMLPILAEAFRVGRPTVALYGIAVRVYAAAQWPDSALKAVDAWVALEPGSEGPYQELGAAALGARDRALAHRAYDLGRERLGPTALAGERAQLATVEGDPETAVAEWIVAAGKVPGYRAAAVSMLSQMAPAARPGVLRSLDKQGSPTAERIAAALTIRWGDPVGGIRRLERGFSKLGDEKVEALQESMDELRGQRGREALMARGIALELLSQAVPDQATRFRLEAAQAYADAGDQHSARRMLSRLAGDPAASPTMAASATSTLVTVLVAEGKLEEASKEFARLRDVLGEDERATLSLKLAHGWIDKGELGQAAEVVANDSTVDGLATRGLISLYQGDLGSARDYFRYAGPFAGERSEAVSRTTLLSLLQVIEEDSLPALGAALLALERRDSTGAAQGLETVGGSLPKEKGGGEALLLAGRVRAGLKDAAGARSLFERVAGFEVPASAAQAELELARLHLAADQKAPAIELLEHLLVTYPASAVVPQARRLLDIAKGAIPPDAEAGRTAR
ncbi:MAG: hypothetical protein AB7R55_02380 [Gemmatimonadales bacterium]